MFLFKKCNNFRLLYFRPCKEQIGRVVYNPVNSSVSGQSMVSTENIPTRPILSSSLATTTTNNSNKINVQKSRNSGITTNQSTTKKPLLSSSLSNIHQEQQGMSHWINDTATAVKSEIRSPGLDTNSIQAASGLTASHLDTSALFCANSSPLDPLQAATSYDHKQEYYNYYGSMQQYTPSFYSSYATPYPSRTSSKLPSPNAYLPSGYASSTNNNSAQIYPGYNYQSFSQFSSHASQQDYSGYYNDYNNYYGAPTYSPYVGSPSSSGSQSFHTPAGLSGELTYMFLRTKLYKRF